MIDTDPRLKASLARLAARDALPVDRMVRESIDILRGAPAPQPRSQALIAARARLSDGRTKLVEKRVHMLRELSVLTGLRKDLESYLLTKYVATLARVRNQHTRHAMIDRALNPIDRRVRPLQSGVEAVNAIIGDYDAKSFSIRDTIAAITLGEREA